MEGPLAPAKIGLHEGEKKMMVATQAELKKSPDTGSWGTSCLSPPFIFISQMETL
jgi:hypothetical protein